MRTRNAAAGGIGPDAAAGARIPLDLSLPKASFTSESEFRREREAILFADWFCVGRAESLPAPGLRRHRAALSLHQVDVDTWGGFVFVRCEPGSGPACPRSSGLTISASSCCPT